MRHDTLVKLAWLYTAGFLGIFLITHIGFKKSPATPGPRG